MPGTSYSGPTGLDRSSESAVEALGHPLAAARSLANRGRGSLPRRHSQMVWSCPPRNGRENPELCGALQERIGCSGYIAHGLHECAVPAPTAEEPGDVV